MKENDDSKGHLALLAQEIEKMVLASDRHSG